MEIENKCFLLKQAHEIQSHKNTATDVFHLLARSVTSIPLYSFFSPHTTSSQDPILVWLSSSHFNKYAVIRVLRDCFLDKSHNNLFNFHFLHESLFLTLSSAYVQINIYILTLLISMTTSYPKHFLSSTDPLEGLSPSFLQFLWDFCFVPHQMLSFRLFWPNFKTRDLFVDFRGSQQQSLSASLKPKGYGSIGWSLAQLQDILPPSSILSTSHPSLDVNHNELNHMISNLLML